MWVFLELAALAALGCTVVFVPFTLFMRALLQRDQMRKSAARGHDGVVAA
jgi:hypothetical protein